MDAFSNRNPGKKRPAPSADKLIEEIRAGQISSLSRAITLLESGRSEFHQTGRKVLNALLPESGKSLRIAISGPPGAGKSTFIEALGKHILEADSKHRIAILAIDPSSQITGGSILGDKTRMEELSRHPRVFIRPSPAGKTLGGVADRTRETMFLCEAAGFDIILIETVGVGQSEIAASEMADLFTLLCLPNAGDDLQGIKRGIMEMAHLILINKAEEDNQARWVATRKNLQSAIRLLPPRVEGWSPRILPMSALHLKGIDQAWETMLTFFKNGTTSGKLEENRKQQQLKWLEDITRRELENLLKESTPYQELKPSIEEKVLNHLISPVEGAQKLIRAWMEDKSLND